jgi:hypothetical protein
MYMRPLTFAAQVAVGAGRQGVELHIDTRTLLRACSGAVGAFTQTEKRIADANSARTYSDQDNAAAGMPRSGPPSHAWTAPYSKTQASRCDGNHDRGQSDSDVHQRRRSDCEEAATEPVLIGSIVRLTAIARVDGVLGTCDGEADGVVVKGSRGCWRVMRLEDYVTGTGRSWRYSTAELIVGVYVHTCIRTPHTYIVKSM